MVFHWSLSGCKFSQVSRTLLNILDVPLVRQHPSPPVPVIILLLLYQKYQTRLVQLSPSCSIVFFQFPSKVEVLIFLFTFFHFYSVVSQDSNLHNFANSLFFFCCCWLLLGLVFWQILGDPSVCQSPIGVHEYHFLGQMLYCEYTISSYGKIKFLAYPPVDHLAHSVGSSLILFLC